MLVSYFHQVWINVWINVWKSGLLLMMLLSVAGFPPALRAQVPGVGMSEVDDIQPNQPLFLQAEKLTGNATPQGFVRELTGNVVLTQGSVRITCNRAVHYIEQNRADLFGNVVLTQGSVTMRAPEGSYDGTARQIAGRGGVTLLDKQPTGRTNTLKARDGAYSTISKIARFYSSVSVENDSLIIRCDTLEYRRATQDSYATGTASAAGKFTSALLQGDSLVNIPATRYTRLSSYAGRKQPMVSQIDTVENETKGLIRQGASRSSTTASLAALNDTAGSGKKKSLASNAKPDKMTKAGTAQHVAKRLDTLCITGNLLEAFRTDTSEIYTATGDVQLTRRQLAARSDVGMYEKTFSRIRLSNVVLPVSTVATAETSASIDLNFTATASASLKPAKTLQPRLWLDSTQLRADSIVILLREKRLERVNAYANAFAASKNDTANQDRIDQLTGENIIINVQNDTLRSIVAEGKAFNLYFGSTDEAGESGETRSVPDGAVRNAADSVKILFESGEVSTIVWRGKVEGEYIPEHIVRKTLSALRLRGFEWMTDRPLLRRYTGREWLEVSPKPSALVPKKPLNAQPRTSTRTSIKSQPTSSSSSGISPSND
jgi:lipopolysaccharide export system protein LptA